MRNLSLLALLLLIPACGDDQPSGLKLSIKQDGHDNACDVGEYQAGTFGAENCDGTNGPGNGELLCTTHEGPVIGCYVQHHVALDMSVWDLCVATCTR